MKTHIKTDEWSVIEDQFDLNKTKASESIFSIGNGRMGQRANFEEDFSGPALQGSYIAGIYYPDKTKVGWWKNGYPEYFAKVINSTNWIGIRIKINGKILDLAKLQVKTFKRVLNMKEGYLSREVDVFVSKQNLVRISSVRFLSMKRKNLGVVKYSLTPLNFNANIEAIPYIDGDVINEDANYHEKFWDVVSVYQDQFMDLVTMKTKKLDFQLASGMHLKCTLDDQEVRPEHQKIKKEKYVGRKYDLSIQQNQTFTIYKYVINVSNLYVKKNQMIRTASKELNEVQNLGFEALFKEQKSAWKDIWKHSDIVIEGDKAAQQGIRFNIFQLNQTYTGDDPRLNIGPKGFTGEKYGGSTYWDTEAYCLPFFLCTAKQEVSKNLLLYRHNHLQKAIENAQKLGFSNGAALYPMVTMNGEECHNEWEITFEEIHRNGAIAFAIYNYIRHTDDKKYLADFGLEVLIAISRFWKQRVNFSGNRQKYVMLGVTGPNEYENNVNNNWYTNKIAVWTLKYALHSMDYVKQYYPEKFNSILQETGFDLEKEPADWLHIIENMYFPKMDHSNIFLQQDNYLDKSDKTAGDLSPENRPLNQHWSWDRILRSPFIKQADVLQGIYLFEDEFSADTIKDNFNYYESRTVHESSLSPCVHSIIAAKIGNIEKAYELYLRTARLDLDDYNLEVDEGLHITSMAGTWMSIVEGFGGKRIKNGMLSLHPMIPDKWNAYSFSIEFRGSILKIKVTKEKVELINLSNNELPLLIYGNEYQIDAKGRLNVNTFKPVSG